MDKKLLDSLNNLSIALQDISDSLKSKSEAKSATAQAMKGGDFSKEIKQISVGVIQLKKDTKQILANQQTIMNMGKNKSKGADVAEGLGKDKQKQKFFKQGIGVILLIAVAVLALGIAFRLVGKVNFLSVIALSIALPLLAIGFAKVHTVLKQVGFEAKKDGINFVIAMVAISTAITVSSWILSMIKPIGFIQAITGILIGAMFFVISNNLENIFIGVAVFHKLKISPLKLIISLVAISAAITASSYVLGLIRPISFIQAITAILIASMFAVIGYSLHKIAAGVAAFKLTGVKSQDLLLVLVGIAAAITASSYVLGLIRPLSFSQAITGILISVLFLVISLNFEKIAFGVAAFKKTQVKATDLLLVLVGIAAAITASSWVLSLIVPIGLMQFLTALGIAILFALMSYVMPQLAVGIYIMEKSLGKKGLFLMPLIFVAISIAIMLSSHILQKTADIKFMTLLRVLALGIILALVVLAFTPAMILLGKMSFKDLLMGGLGVVIIATAIMVSSLILSLGKYDKYPDWKWALGVGLSIIMFAPGVVILGILAMADGGLSQILGAVMVLIVATAIMATSHILGMGKYDKYPPILWTLGTVAAMLPFAVAMVALGFIAISGIGAIAMIAGAIAILGVAKTIVETAKILALGKYDKYPALLWTLGTVAAMLPFAVAMVALGFIAISGIGAVAMIAGAVAILGVAETIVETSKILDKGKYAGGPPLWWSLGVGLVMTGFGLAILLLGSFIVGTLGFGWIALKAGSAAVSLVAQSIVDASIILQKGKYVGGPTKEWAEGIAIALGAFSPIYSMLMASGVLKLFGGGGVSPDDFAQAIVTVSGGIIDAAKFFAENTAVFKNGPSKEWAEGVGTAIGAFAPVFQVLQDSAPGLFSSGGPSVEDMAVAIMTISQGIVEAARFFANPEISALFNTEGNYPSEAWGRGVGAALNAFAPVFKSLSEDTGWFTSGTDVVDGMTYGVRALSYSLVDAAIAFSSVDPASWTSYPSHTWAEGVRTSITSFLDIFSVIEERGYSIFTFQMYSKVLQGAIKSISLSAAYLWASKKFFGFKLDKSWVTNLSKSVLGYAALTQQLDKMLGFDEKTSIKSGGFLGVGGSTTTKTTRKMKDVSIVNRIVSQLVETAKILYTNRKSFSFKLDANWVSSLRTNLLDYAKLAKDIEKSLNVKEIVNISLGKFGNYSFQTTRTADVGVVNKIVHQLVTSAKLIYDNKKFFSFKLDPNWVRYLRFNLLDYVYLARDIEDAMTIHETTSVNLGRFGSYEFHTTRTADVGLVNKMTNQLVMTAGILWKNKKFFENKIDPNYVRNMATNIKDFAKLVRYLSKDDSLSTGVLSMFGLDPISRAAYGMNKMASAFDKLASSLNKFSSAIKSVDGQKVNMIRKLTGNIAILSSMDSKMFNNMMTVLERRGNVFSKLLDSPRGGAGPSVGEKPGGGQREVWAKKPHQGPVDSKGESALHKLDRIAHLLDSINRNVDTVDDLVNHILTAKKDENMGKDPK